MKPTWPSSSTEILSSIESQLLRPYESTKRSQGLELAFSVRRSAAQLDFHFHLSGPGLEQVMRPLRRGPSVRKDELWKHTCLELFVGPEGAQSYLEMNLAPSGDWNLYAFDSYRVGMRPADGEVIALATEASANGQSWIGFVRGPEVERLLGESRQLVMGATAVVEYEGGEREYWALEHAGSKPDFHLRESFRLRL